MWLRRPRKIGMKLARQGLQPKTATWTKEHKTWLWPTKMGVEAVRMLSWLWTCRLHGPRKSWSFVLWPCGCTSHWVPAVSMLVLIGQAWKNRNHILNNWRRSYAANIQRGWHEPRFGSNHNGCTSQKNRKGMTIALTFTKEPLIFKIF